MKKHEIKEVKEERHEGEEKTREEQDKQELLALYAELQRRGIRSISDLEHQISLL